ncbi:hydroxyacid dehydrogenase [Patescibacteria group bacterium]|nr:hydroxyacid dehydrogenase [Patescibacteria group bacterium]
MKIGFFELEGWEQDQITAALPVHELSFSKERITAGSLPERRDLEVLSIFVNSRLDAQALSAFPDLKCIATRSTGYDHIDLAECKKRGIAVLYVPGYGDNTVAEFAFGLLLNLTRHLYRAIDEIKRSGSFALADLRGVDLAHKTIGVIGTGRIGKKMIKICKGFEMDVIAADPYPDAKAAAELGFTYVSFEDLLKRSDVITFHCLYTPQNKHLLNRNNIGFMKKGAYVINTARGALIETGALVSALKRGELAGAGLDVLEEENETKASLSGSAPEGLSEEALQTVALNKELMQMPNVLVTPHTAFNSQEALVRILTTALGDITAFTAGQIVNQVPDGQ